MRINLNENDIRLKGLTKKQKVFVIEYIKDYNGRRAAKVAGYSNPKRASFLLLNEDRNPKIHKILKQFEKLTIQRSVLERDQILEELSSFAMRDIIELCNEEGELDLSDLRKLSPEIRRCIESIEQEPIYGKNKDGERIIVRNKTKIKLVGKIAAFELLGKFMGLNAPQRIEVKEQTASWDELVERSKKPKD